MTVSRGTEHTYIIELTTMGKIAYTLLPRLLIATRIFFCVGSTLDHSQRDKIFSIDIEWSCKYDNDCSIPSSTCKEDKCQCLPGYVYNEDMTACLRVASKYGDTCEEAIQCSRYLLTGGKCIDNACVCAPGFHYLHGRCYETVDLGGKCKNNDDCHVNQEFGSTICDNGICKCSTGSYQREYRSCRPAASNVGDECFINLDCKLGENAYCDDLVCALKEEEKSSYKTSNASFVSRLTESYVKSEIPTKWNNCINDADCKMYGNAICSASGKCTCTRGYFVPSKSKSQVCVPELGESCQATDEVSIASSICKNDVWMCTQKKVASRDNRSCLKATRTYNTSCTQDQQCYVFGPDAVCPNKRCICNEKSHFIKDLQFCWRNRGIGEDCRSTEDCYVEGLNDVLVCRNNVCDCPEGTHLNSERTACINSKAELGMFCEFDKDCITPNSVCEGNVCACNQTYYEINKRCYPGINATCNVYSTLNKCQPQLSVCTSGVCTCMDGYVGVSTSTCLPNAKHGEPCTQDAQCNAEIPDAICATDPNNQSTKLCACPEDRFLQYSKCFKKRVLGESCTSQGECYLDFDQRRAICMNGVCTCDWQYVRVSDTSCQKILEGRRIPSNGAVATFSRTCLPILSISLILLLDLIRWV